MRRSDREIIDPELIRKTIDDCSVCRIGFNDNGEVYIIPLNFGYICEDGKYVFYFHGAKEGRKFDLASQNPCVGFEMDTDYKLNESDAACSFSARFRSIIGTGRISVLSDEEERIKGLGRIMHKATGRSDWDFPPAALAKTAVFRLEVTELSCKEHK